MICAAPVTSDRFDRRAKTNRSECSPLASLTLSAGAGEEVVHGGLLLVLDHERLAVLGTECALAEPTEWPPAQPSRTKLPRPMDNADGASRSREERIALNESLCRELNRRKVLWMKTRLPTANFRCECGELRCGRRFVLSETEWKEVRSRPNRFAVAPEHIAPDVESVVKEYPDFWIVEKQGEAEGIAEQLD